MKVHKSWQKFNMCREAEPQLTRPLLRCLSQAEMGLPLTATISNGYVWVPQRARGRGVLSCVR